MENRNLGKSDVFVTPIAFGGWAIGGWMWGGADKKDGLNALSKSIELGITTIDTAPAYGFGQSEELVGQAIKGIREKVQILTKFGLKWEGNKGSFYFTTKDNQGKSTDMYLYSSKKSVIKECEDSLKRLKTDYIDLYQIHWPDSTTPIEETMEAMNILLEQGKIRAVGVCNFDKELLEKASAIVPIVSVQVPYSMVRKEIESELVPWCIENNTSIIAYSPLQRGLLTGKFSVDSEFKDGDNRGDTPYFQKQNIKKTNAFLQEIKEIADSKNAKISQLVIRWTLDQPGISCALVGARDTQQVEENAGALGFDLSKDEISFIDEKLQNLKMNL